jgi:hypothetical protein
MIDKLRWAAIDLLLWMVGWLLPQAQGFQVKWDAYENPVLTILEHSPAPPPSRGSTIT